MIEILRMSIESTWSVCFFSIFFSPKCFYYIVNVVVVVVVAVAASFTFLPSFEWGRISSFFLSFFLSFFVDFHNWTIREWSSRERKRNISTFPIFAVIYGPIQPINRSISFLFYLIQASGNL